MMNAGRINFFIRALEQVREILAVIPDVLAPSGRIRCPARGNDHVTGKFERRS
jgi:hypothetical protein